MPAHPSVASARSRRVDLIGVPFDGMGRADAQSRAPEVLRAAGLGAAFGAGTVMEPDLVLPEPSSERARGSGLLNERALLRMIETLRARVGSSLSRGRFPFVFGADCSVLLAAVPALRELVREPGLLFLDAHEDATPLHLSPDGEVANMEIALLLGLDGERAARALPVRLPALLPAAIAMLGPRDGGHRRPLNIPTVADRVWLRTPDDLSADPAGAAIEAVEHITSSTFGWWLHTDLDVLARAEFAACGAPGEALLPGGLTWLQLTEIVSTALRAGGCRGWSLAVYNPDLDPDGSAAVRIVEFVTEVARRCGL
jgi:arginase